MISCILIKISYVNDFLGHKDRILFQIRFFFKGKLQALNRFLLNTCMHHLLRLKMVITVKAGNGLAKMTNKRKNQRFINGAEREKKFVKVRRNFFFSIIRSCEKDYDVGEEKKEIKFFTHGQIV